MTRPLTESKLANLDLNLLVSLDALLQERSVSRAALRLGLSQPSLSAALARLRRHFRDDLLDRVGNHYELTPLAALLQQAPHVRLRLHQVPIPVVDVAQALRDVDAMVLPHGYLSDLPSQQLFTDQWVCVVAADHPGIGDKLTLTDLEELPMVVAHHEPASYTPAGKQLSMLGVQPRVQLVAETFLALPFLVAAGNGVALIQERLARQLAPAVPIRVLPCPFDVAPLIEALWWHPMYARDPGHTWLRQLFADAAELAHLGTG